MLIFGGGGGKPCTVLCLSVPFPGWGGGPETVLCLKNALRKPASPVDVWEYLWPVANGSPSGIRNSKTEKNRKQIKKKVTKHKRRAPSVFAIYWRPKLLGNAHAPHGTWRPQVRTNRLERLTTWRTGRTSRRRKNYCLDDAAVSGGGSGVTIKVTCPRRR